MSLGDYQKALRAGKQNFEDRSMRGEQPTLPVLDDLLPSGVRCAESTLGIMNIPLDRIVGTRHEERSYSFAANFMPLLDDGSEFASKWAAVADYHRDTGIADPIKAYEYLHNYYVEEGNKRVSVMKYFDAVSIPAKVIRVLPPKSDDPEIRAYYEYLKFYETTGITDIVFNTEGKYPALLAATGKDPSHLWTDDERVDFRSLFTRFKELYTQTGGDRSVSMDEVFLEFLIIQNYDEVQDLPQSKLRDLIVRTQSEFKLLAKNHPVDLVTEPPQKRQQSLFARMFSSSGMSHVKVAFLYEKTIRSSSWTYAHELGRLSLMHAYPNEIETEYYENVTEENVDAVLKDAIARGNRVIFTTTPVFAQASVRAAIANPQVKIVNCSINTSYRNIRTYYPRIHEAKFVLGALAASMSTSDRLFYLGDYPLYGSIASINAFALGAQMVNPRAEVYLDWSSRKDIDVDETIRRARPGCVLGKDMIVPNEEARYFGLYSLEGKHSRRLAMPVVYWGKLYQKLVEAISDGTWDQEERDTPEAAINYWWGMSSDIVGIFYASNLPLGTIRMIRLLMDTIKKGEFYPFSGRMFSQDGLIIGEPRSRMSPEDIVHMDWLAENVIGEIPSFDQLTPQAAPVVLRQGVPEAVSGNVLGSDLLPKGNSVGVEAIPTVQTGEKLDEDLSVRDPQTLESSTDFKTGDVL